MDIIIVKPGFELITSEEEIKEYPKLIEIAGRTCYKSEDKITENSADRFVKMIMKSGHHSVIEHLSITVRIIGDRSMSHQLVRHRLNSFSQESQRYCNYTKGKFNNNIQVVCPPSIEEDKNRFGEWKCFIHEAYRVYESLIKDGIKAEDARSVLPNACKTEIVMTANLRQWLHVFNERALNRRAQWQIRGIMEGILTKFAELLPSVYGDQYIQLQSIKSYE